MAFLRCPQCAVKCGTHYVPYDVLRDLKMGFNTLQYSKCESLLKKYLTEEIMEHLKYRKTSNHVNLYDCIKCGLESYECEIGAFACDPECYFVFWPIFFPILQELHGFSSTDIHPKSEWGPVSRVSNLESRNEFIKLTRIRVNRNLKGYPFVPEMTHKDFENLEQYLEMILALMTGEYDGQYEKISNMTEDRKRELRDKFILVDNTNEYLKAGGCYRCWPTGRGVFMNSQETYIAQINPSDHLKVISVEYGGNIRRVYRRLTKAILKLQRDLNFIKSSRMGCVTLCPSDMGTGLKVSIILHLPLLSKDVDSLMKHVETLDVAAKNLPNQPQMFEIYNKKRMGVTEIDTVLSVERAVLNLINMELDAIN